MASSHVVDKVFSADELARLLTEAAVHLLNQCRDVYCEPAPPQRFVFLPIPSDEREHYPPRRAYSASEAVRYLLREDGAFREWINVSPVGTRSGSTVLELCYATKFTRGLFTGSLAAPFEPFQLRGPSLPPDWTDGDPVPRVTLPELDL